MFNHRKARQFTAGRKNLFGRLQDQLIPFRDRQTIWCHVSSLGEFEQARPILSEIKERYPETVIALSFFSPSGMNHAQTEGTADIKFYIPRDSEKNARRLFDILSPCLCVFVKYDLWHYYIAESRKRQVPHFLISAHFREHQIYFRPWGGFYRLILRNLTRIYTQNMTSIRLLEKIRVSHATVAGDTRIDAVIRIKSERKSFPRIEQFIDPERELIIAGSAWEDDIRILKKCYDEVSDTHQLIIAPHDIRDSFIEDIQSLFSGYKVDKYSDTSGQTGADILIIDTIGLLKYIYRYAAISWIGGGFRSSGIHNILEPAVYGNAVFTGPNYKKFPEAIDLISNGGAVTSDDATYIAGLFKDKAAISKMGDQSLKYVLSHAGATQKIMKDLSAYL